MPLSLSVRAKLAGLSERFEEVGALLSDSEVLADRHRFEALSREFAELEPVTRGFERFKQLERELEESEALVSDGDAELRELAQEEAAVLGQRLLSLNRPCAR